MAYVFDTDVLIDYLRGNPAAVDAVELRIDTAYLSTMTVAEIYQGVRESERTAVTRAMSALTLLPISAEIAEMGGLFRRDYKGLALLIA
jgi:predicted nucleic acid-binding protein